MHWLYASQWLFLFWVSASQFDIVTAENFCTRTVSRRRNAEDKCGQWLSYVIRGYNVDREKSNLTDYNDSVLNRLFLEWASKSEQSPFCFFYRYEDEQVTECCAGWTGPTCIDPICDPQCANGGECYEPGLCRCVQPYTGTACLDDETAVTDTSKYCYVDVGCNGEKASDASYVVLKDDCCSSLKGRAWGLSGHSCEVCSTSLTSNEYSDFTPDRPQVVTEVVKLPYQTCMGTGPNFYRTFDRVEYLFPGRCTCTLFNDGIRSVTVQPLGCHMFSTCKKRLTFLLNNQDSVVAEGDFITSNSIPVEIQESQGFASPSGRVHIERKGEFHYLTYGNLRARWDNGSSWFLTLEEQPRPINSTTITGLCGNFDGVPENDLTNRFGQSVDPSTFGNSFTVYDHNNPKCPDAPPETTQCNETTIVESTKVCTRILHPPFKNCHKTVFVKSYFQRCVNDYCAASSQTNPTLRASEQNTVVCNAFSAYSQVCFDRGIRDLNWRTTTLCPKSCPYQMEYSDCLTTCLTTCANMYVVKRIAGQGTECYPGCRCPSGMVLGEGECIAPEACPCPFQGRTYSPGSNVRTACNNCTCKNGRWACSDEPCTKTCSVYGMGHFQTFDGKDYDFYGPECTYIAMELRSDVSLVRGTGITFVSYTTSKICGNTAAPEHTCIISVIVEFQVIDKKSVVVMSRSDGSLGFVVRLNDVELQGVYVFPAAEDFIIIKRVSNFFIGLFGPGFRILFGKNGELHIRLSPWYSGKIQGLCGDMDGSVDNEFTSRNQIPESLGRFALSFSDCTVTDYIDIDFCKFNSKSLFLTDSCDRILSNYTTIFPGCSLPITRWRFLHAACRQDVCGMDEGVTSVCSIYAYIGKTCSEQGVDINWITADPALQSLCLSNADFSCDLPTQFGLKYQACTSTIKTCRDLSLGNIFSDGDEFCIPGCACSQGRLMDSDGRCVPVSSCTCIDNRNVTHGPGETIRQGCRDCMCTNGTWVCGVKDCTTEIKCDNNQVYLLSRDKCNSSCANYAQKCDGNEEITEQCGCPEPLVLDPYDKCIHPDECPCSYNNEYHLPGTTVPIACGECTCVARDWKCLRDERHCSGICSATGDPHYVTFDGMRYTFEGSCEYILTESVTDPRFQITAANVPCGSSGSTCTKSLKIDLVDLHIRLVKGSEPQVNNVTIREYQSYRFGGGSVHQTGLMTVFQFDIGLGVSWDGGD